MRRGRILIFLLLIVVIGLVVVFVAVRTLLGNQAKPTQTVTQNVEVFVAGQNIPQGATITEDQLATISLPQNTVSAVEFTSDKKADLVGKIAKFPLDQGTVITTAMVGATFSGPGGGSPWASSVPAGMTAISIPGGRLSTVSFGIGDGDHVNLQSCFLFVDVDPAFQSETPDATASLTGTGFPQNALPVLSLAVGGAGGVQGRLELDPSLQQPFFLVPSEQQRPRPVCQTILQNVVVLKRGNFPLSTASTQASQQQAQQQQQGAAPAPDVITLLVSPQDAVTLQYMVYTNAQIMMTLRNPSDQSRLATEAATLQFLLSQYNIPVPAKLPYALQPRIDALSAPVLPNEGATTTSP